MHDNSSTVVAPQQLQRRGTAAGATYVHVANEWPRVEFRVVHLDAPQSTGAVETADDVDFVIDDDASRPGTRRRYVGKCRPLVRPRVVSTKRPPFYYTAFNDLLAKLEWNLKLHE